LKRLFSIVLLTVLVSGFNFFLVKSECPTYQTNLIIDLVNSTPSEAAVGTTVVTTVHVIYPDRTPVFLSPETISFSWSGHTGQKIIENAAVVPTGEPGYYTYTEKITEYFPTGVVVISSLYCTCSDAPGNRGPTTDTSSDNTITVIDYSKVNIGPQTPKPTATQPPPSIIQQLLTTYAVPIVILALLIIALLLLLTRGRRKRT
jgi:hypothetical protein